ncbi:NtaA/DmoA family FMN-dependent monooxygenase [Nocardioides bruguierae]|uniref:NtaA/DmoA family FMN-dependent monooxygenase n=1 Tax=Nocardioides bruguierae TaxID=2945102 RepID=UPI0020208182|nr:NtaA/DmoA family FMN-dependent monooxygenase [Nocardioides bruguierae]MCL8026228.1 NtaA/DmoA family FMN-dependent monooxygenase [Nocardioides bruguierae]
MFHLGCFVSFRPPVWNNPLFDNADAESWPEGDIYLHLAKQYDKAGFDYLMFEDSSMVSDIHGGTMEADLKHSLYAPKHDPVLLAPLLADATKGLGIITTVSTSFTPPFMLARSMSTLSHLSSGRIGWNMVTSSEDRAAQNYGMDALPDHDERYQRADEYVDVVKGLWGTWDPDAVVLDKETGTFVDHEKVRTLDHEGEYFKVRGPLNALPPFGGQPVLCQAGASPRGRDFAARNADTIIASAQGQEAMKALRDDMRERAEKFGRDPDSLKVMFVVTPMLGADDAEVARLKQLAERPDDVRVESTLGHLSCLTENDFSTFDLDAVVPEVTTNGHRSTLENFLVRGQGKTLREIASTWGLDCVPLEGTPDAVAERMGEVMDFVGGDGFLITGQVSRAHIDRIADGLVPALQARGLTRTEYTGTTMRENLMAF